MHKGLARMVAIIVAGFATTWCGYANAQTITLSNGVQKGPPIGVEEGPPLRIC